MLRSTLDLLPAQQRAACAGEDVPMSLVPLSSLGQSLGVPTPTIDMIIQLAQLLHGKDYRREGRTVERLGIAGLSIKQIRQLVVGVEPLS